MKTLSLTAAPFIILGLVSACSSASDEEALGSETQPLWLATGAVLWPGGQVNTCFTSSVSVVDRTMIRNLVEDNWEREANINFYGWGSCPTLNSSTTNLVAVSIDGSLGAGVLGRSARCQDGTLGTCVGNEGKAPSGDFNRVQLLSRSAQGGDAVFRHTVLHEFGHVLGFQHEDDTGCVQRTSGAVCLDTGPDLSQSVMTIAGCSATPHETLSNWDVLGARRAYGRKPAGSFVGLNGLCLDIAGASTALGASVVGYPCAGATNDTFFRDGLMLRSNMATPRCLNVHGGVVSPTNATPITSWDCVDTAENERFHFTGVQWRAMGKMCVAAESTVVGANISIANCNGSSLQQWDFFEDEVSGSAERIRLSGTTLCVEVPSNPGLGSDLVLGNCNSTPQSNERFSSPAGGILQPFSPSTLCLNVKGGTTSTGSRITLWDGCNDNVHNNKFTIRGPIKSLGQCVDMLGGVPTDNVGIGVYPCQTGAPNEQWDYVW